MRKIWFPFYQCKVSVLPFYKILSSLPAFTSCPVRSTRLYIIYIMHCLAFLPLTSLTQSSSFSAPVSLTLPGASYVSSCLLMLPFPDKPFAASSCLLFPSVAACSTVPTLCWGPTTFPNFLLHTYLSSLAFLLHTYLSSLAFLLHAYPSSLAFLLHTYPSSLAFLLLYLLCSLDSFLQLIPVRESFCSLPINCPAFLHGAIPFSSRSAFFKAFLQPFCCWPLSFSASLMLSLCPFQPLLCCPSVLFSFSYAVPLSFSASLMLFLCPFQPLLCWPSVLFRISYAVPLSFSAPLVLSLCPFQPLLCCPSVLFSFSYAVHLSFSASLMLSRCPF
jgi:hypothetical protein